MIHAEKLTYSAGGKELYNNVSFSIEMGQHCALIGSNGKGKSTLAEIIMDPVEYMFDGKLIRDESCRIGYANQFSVRDKVQDRTVFEFLSERFIEVQQEIAAVCEEMAEAEDLDDLFVKYQELLDLNESMDGDNFESNIKKQLYVARMTEIENTSLADISGGEYKILQIMREMLLAPNLLILDEPDAFLDFRNLHALSQLINHYKGTMLVITHNRYLLNHCFNKILHLEGGDIQEFEGSYTEYRVSQFREKLELKKQHMEEEEEIERTQHMVDVLRKRATDMVNPVIGKSVHAKQSQLDRLRARRIKAPFVEIREPEFELPKVEVEKGHPVLTVTDYQVNFDKSLLENVNFELLSGDRAAIVGANGTGKTTLVRDIICNNHPSIHIDENIKFACLSQLQEEIMDGDKSVYQIMQDLEIYTEEAIEAFLRKFCLEDVDIYQKVSHLSGGEQNMLQIAIITQTDAELLILDEPTSHLDIFAQAALEKAIAAYKGTVLIVSHDFYLVANCADYVLLIEDNTFRRVRGRTFRKNVYDRYFDQKYLESDRKKQELETEIALAFKNNNTAAVEKLCGQLEALK